MAIDNTQTLPGAVPQNDSGAQPQMVSPVAPAPQAPSQAPQAPTQQPTQQQPSVTSAPVPPSPNQRLHSFVSSVLGGITSSLAGRPAVKYSVDPTTGKMGPDPNQPEDTRGNQVRRILGNALVPKRRINRPSSKPTKIMSGSNRKSCSSIRLPTLMP
jgi:hypothetical protein